MQRAGVAQTLAPGPLPLAPVWADGGWPGDSPCNALSPEGSRCDWLLKRGLATWQQSDALDALPSAATDAASSATTGAATDAATDAATNAATDAANDVPRSNSQNLQPLPLPPAALLRRPQPQPDGRSPAAAEAAAASVEAVEAEQASLSAYRAQLLREGVTYNLSAVAPLPPLPVLRANNTRQYPEWHAYAQRLYGARGVARSFPLDLNELSWFYWFAPLKLQSLYLCDWEDHYAQVTPSPCPSPAPSLALALARTPSSALAVEPSLAPRTSQKPLECSDSPPITTHRRPTVRRGPSPLPYPYP